jgi:hypothetical protein
MKISFVMDGGDNLSGGHRAIAKFAQGLVRLGHTVSLVARPQRPPSLRDRARRVLKGTGDPEPKPKPSHFESAGLRLKVLPSWRPVEDRDLPEADVVLATWWETVQWVHGLAAGKGVKMHFMQGYEIWGGPADQVDLSCRVPMPRIVTADWLGELLENQFHQTPLAVIPAGVDLAVFQAPPRGKQTIPTVGLTYAATPNKGCDISIEAVRLARRTLPELCLVACGSTRISGDLPLPEGTRYEAWASDNTMRELYSRCDAWLFGTRREGFGLPILEAMACRTPVIGTPAGAAPRLLVDGAGRLVKPEDPEDMAQAILDVCRLPESQWRTMSAAAHATASLNSWDDGVQAFDQALRQVVLR